MSATARVHPVAQGIGEALRDEVLSAELVIGGYLGVSACVGRPSTPSGNNKRATKPFSLPTMVAAPHGGGWTADLVTSRQRPRLSRRWAAKVNTALS